MTTGIPAPATGSTSSRMKNLRDYLKRPNTNPWDQRQQLVRNVKPTKQDVKAEVTRLQAEIPAATGFKKCLESLKLWSPPQVKPEEARQALVKQRVEQIRENSGEAQFKEVSNHCDILSLGDSERKKVKDRDDEVALARVGRRILADGESIFRRRSNPSLVSHPIEPLLFSNTQIRELYCYAKRVSIIPAAPYGGALYKDNAEYMSRRTQQYNDHETKKINDLCSLIVGIVDKVKAEMAPEIAQNPKLEGDVWKISGRLFRTAQVISTNFGSEDYDWEKWVEHPETKNILLEQKGDLEVIRTLVQVFTNDASPLIDCLVTGFSPTLKRALRPMAIQIEPPSRSSLFSEGSAIEPEDPRFQIPQQSPIIDQHTVIRNGWQSLKNAFDRLDETLACVKVLGIEEDKISALIEDVEFLCIQRKEGILDLEEICRETLADELEEFDPAEKLTAALKDGVDPQELSAFHRALGRIMDTLEAMAKKRNPEVVREDGASHAGTWIGSDAGERVSERGAENNDPILLETLNQTFEKCLNVREHLEGKRDLDVRSTDDRNSNARRLAEFEHVLSIARDAADGYVSGGSGSETGGEANYSAILRRGRPSGVRPLSSRSVGQVVRSLADVTGAAAALQEADELASSRGDFSFQDDSILGRIAAPVPEGDMSFMRGNFSPGRDYMQGPLLSPLTGFSGILEQSSVDRTSFSKIDFMTSPGPSRNRRSLGADHLERGVRGNARRRTEHYQIDQPFSPRGPISDRPEVFPPAPEVFPPAEEGGISSDDETRSRSHGSEYSPSESGSSDSDERAARKARASTRHDRAPSVEPRSNEETERAKTPTSAKHIRQRGRLFRTPEPRGEGKSDYHSEPPAAPAPSRSKNPGRTLQTPDGEYRPQSPARRRHAKGSPTPPPRSSTLGVPAQEQRLSIGRSQKYRTLGSALDEIVRSGMPRSERDRNALAATINNWVDDTLGMMLDRDGLSGDSILKEKATHYRSAIFDQFNQLIPEDMDSQDEEELRDYFKKARNEMFPNLTSPERSTRRPSGLPEVQRRGHSSRPRTGSDESSSDSNRELKALDSPRSRL